MLVFAKLRRFYKSATCRLALTYLAIIMLMSIGFSVEFYRTSWHELGRQLLPSGYIEKDANSGFDADDAVNQFLHKRVDEGRNDLLVRLFMLNVIALVGGGGVSYLLARRTLKPIEAAMEAQSRFVGDASHELRTPLTTIQATNEVALRKSKLSIQEAKELLRQNMAEAAKLKDLSDGLLSLAKQDGTHLKMADVSVQSVVSEAMNQIVGPALAKHIAVEDESPNISVVGNLRALTQVMVILLDNAIKYSPERTTIHIYGRQKGKYVYLYVKDQGRGIRATDMEHIFRRFYRADQSRNKDQGQGYGLGLSIARKIIEQHHGTIGVESTIGKGSTFTVRLMASKRVI